MKVIHGPCISVDCDDTVVLWESLRESPPADPQSDNWAVIQHNDRTVWGIVLQETVESIIRHKLQGHHVTLWTKAGAAWAESVARSLGIEKYVDIAKTKDFCYYDDRPLNELGDRKNMLPQEIRDMQAEQYEEKMAR